MRVRRPVDGVQHQRRAPAEDEVVRESENLETMAAQPGVPPRVVCPLLGIVVRPAVQLDDQARRVAERNSAT